MYRSGAGFFGGAAALAASFLSLLLLTGGALAHQRASGAPVPGIEIESLSHGQMAAVADYRARILDLAARQTRTDETFRRLLNYGNLQYTYCLWGLMPGSIGDEASPFNACSHAYLAAARALLAYMQDMPEARDEATALVSELDMAMVRGGAAWVMCAFSATTFTTGTVVKPRWRDVARHPPSLLASVLAGTGIAGAGMALARTRGPRHSGVRERPESAA